MAEEVTLNPSSIKITETYTYRTNISGSRRVELVEPKGEIKLLIHYDKRRLIASPRGQQLHNDLIHNFRSYQIGYFHIKDYGFSNLNEHPNLDWDKDMLPIRVLIDRDAPEIVIIQQRNCFDLQLLDTYKPDELKNHILTVDTKIVDEDPVIQQTATAASHGTMLVEDLSKQGNLKHNLIIEFSVKVELPKRFGSLYLTKPLRVSRMALNWPHTTPYRMAKIRVGDDQHPLINYDAEQGIIEWTGVLLKPLSMSNDSISNTFVSDKIEIEISEPIDFHRQMELSGFVQVEIEGLLSGVDLEYIGQFAINHSPSVCNTILENEFTFNLKENINRKLFSPRQHLYFHGVVLDEMRIADILMLLEDKGFELRKHEWRSTDAIAEEGLGKKYYDINAERDEGTKCLKIVMKIEGVDASTTRERNILGKAKYTTSLPRGDTSIYIAGELVGDSKRVVSVINEIQKQLKEQFRHVGTAE